MSKVYKRTTDLWFTSFLQMHDYILAKFEMIRKGKGAYYFDMPDEDWAEMKMKFINDDISKVKQLMESLKDLCH